MILLCTALLAAASPAPAQAPPRIRIEASVSFTASLVHWVDNLAGSSLGKTTPTYRHLWQQRFGSPDAEDLKAIETFARIRRLPLGSSGGEVANAAGCLPVETDSISWHQAFLIEAMKAGSIDSFVRGLSSWLGEADRAGLAGSLERFRPRFEKVWKDLDYVRRFESRFEEFLRKEGLRSYLDQVAGYFEVDPAALPPMRISWIGLPDDGPTHAEADGDHLLIEIRPLDRPVDQVQVVAHEATHFIMRRVPASRLDALARAAFAESEAGALVWRYMWEGLPTALGQGLAEARLAPRLFSTAHSWYHIGSIDRFAKLIYPAVAEALSEGRRLDEPMMARMARLARGSPLHREARPAESLMTAFFVAGAGLADGMEGLRRRQGLWGGPTPTALAPSDPALRELMARYECLPGAALVDPSELEALSALAAPPLLGADQIEAGRQAASSGAAAILVGRRATQAPVYVLVAPDQASVPGLIAAFGRLRGPQSVPVILGKQDASR